MRDTETEMIFSIPVLWKSLKTLVTSPWFWIITLLGLMAFILRFCKISNRHIRDNRNTMPMRSVPPRNRDAKPFSITEDTTFQETRMIKRPIRVLPRRPLRQSPIYTKKTVAPKTIEVSALVHRSPFHSGVVTTKADTISIAKRSSSAGILNLNDVESDAGNSSYEALGSSFEGDEEAETGTPVAAQGKKRSESESSVEIINEILKDR